MSILQQNCKPLFLYLFFHLMVLAGCVLPKTTQTRTKQKPGLYGLTGWNGAWVDPATNTAKGIDIDGKVGYPLELGRPTANCVSSEKSWTSYLRIISGELPPGVYIESVSIKGIPEKRGHFIAVVESYSIKCNGIDYGSLKQELRIHITGTGIVAEGRKELITDDKVKVTYEVSRNDVKFYVITQGSPSINVDVNKNGIIDEMADRSYGMDTYKLLCAQYLIDESVSTRCGAAPSKAKLSVRANEYVFTIPKNELSIQTNPGTVSVKVRVAVNANGGWSWYSYPSGTNKFSNTFEIDVR